MYVGKERYLVYASAGVSVPSMWCRRIYYFACGGGGGDGGNICACVSLFSLGVGLFHWSYDCL